MDSSPQATALCLSGGGFRALHWHLGSLRALNAQGMLAKVDTLSGVSAGALVAAWLGLHWAKLDFDARGRARGLESAVLAPLTALAQLRIGLPASAAALLGIAGLPARLLASELDRLLFRGARLGDLPAAPAVLLTSVDLDCAEALVFSRAGVEHPLQGLLAAPTLPLVQAVTASCAFTPFFAPALVQTGAGGQLLRLADGVLQDNTALDAVWDTHGTLLLSDASLPAKRATPIRGAWHSVLLHSQRSQFHHARRVRLRLLREQFAHGLRRGAWWGLAGEWFSSGAAPGSGTAEVSCGTALGEELLAHGRVAANFLRLPEQVQRTLENGAEQLAGSAVAEIGRRRESGAAADTGGGS